MDNNHSILFNSVSKLRKHMTGEKPKPLATSATHEHDYPSACHHHYHYNTHDNKPTPGWLDFVPFNHKTGFHNPLHPENF